MAMTLSTVSLNDNSTWYTLLNLVYPVGSLYISYTSTSPSSRFGGTWSQITNRFLYCTTNTNTNGSNDAVVVSHNHTASTSSAGNHTHTIDTSGVIFTSTQYVQAGSTYSATCDWGPGLTVSKAGAHTHTVTVNSKGESGSGKNMPAYQGVYCWRRTA